MPVAEGVNEGLDAVAVPPLPVRATVPKFVPAVVQAVAVVKGPHTEKVTVPVGVTPLTPTTVALSELEAPRTIEPLAGEVVPTEGAGVTVKHSRVVDESEPPA